MGGEGGTSQSSTATATTTTNTDKRLVVDGGSLGISNDGALTYSSTDARQWSDSSTHYTTDAGAVAAGRAIALSGIAANSTNADHLYALADHLFSNQENALAANVKLTGSLAATAQTAYSDASNQASGNKQLILAAMAVVGVVAFVSLKK